MKWKYGVLAFPVVLVVALVVPSVATAELPVSHRVKILLTVLSYDKNLKAKCGAEIHIGLVYRPGHSKSEREARAMRNAINSGAAKQINGLPIEASLVGFEGAGTAEPVFTKQEVDVVYICFGLGDQLPRILDVAARLDLLTTTGEKKYVETGVAVGVTEQAGRAKIFVNPKAVTDQGSEFDPRLLRLAKLVY